MVNAPATPPAGKPSVAVMTVAPGASAVTVPAPDTLAMAGSAAVQVARVVTMRVEPSANRPMASRKRVSPLPRAGLSGVSTSAIRAGAGAGKSTRTADQAV